MLPVYNTMILAQAVNVLCFHLFVYTDLDKYVLPHNLVLSAPCSTSNWILDVWFLPLDGFLGSPILRITMVIDAVAPVSGKLHLHCGEVHRLPS